MTYLNEEILIETGFDELITRLNNPDISTRRLALIELADAGLIEHQPILIAALADENESIRSEAAQLLVGWEDEAVVDALALRLLDQAESVRVAAAQSLFELKTSVAGLRLIRWLSHDDDFALANSLRAVRELRLPAAKPAALIALEHPNAEVRREAAGVLGWLKDHEALPALANLVLNDSDAEVRRIATGALGFASDTAVLAPLLAALNDPEWQIRDEAASTLGKLKFKEAVTELIRTLDEDIWQISLKAARALGKIGDAQALPSLISSLAHPAGNLRKEAAIALGEIADAKAESALQIASKDPDPEVRKSSQFGAKPFSYNMIVPTKITQTDAGLILHWGPDRVTRLSTRLLRQSCRCAECQSAKLQNQPVNTNPDLQILEIKPIGHYAAQLVFSDGHERGIFPWPYLYELGEDCH